MECHFWLGACPDSLELSALKYGFLKKSFNYECQLTISSHHFWVGFLLHPPKSGDWKWSTDKGAFMVK